MPSAPTGTAAHHAADQGFDAALVLSSTVKSLERGLMLNESLFDRYPHVIVSTDFIKSDRRRHEFVLRCPELVIVDEAHNSVAGSAAGQVAEARGARGAARRAGRPSISVARGRAGDA